MKMHFFTVPAKWPERILQALNAFCAQRRVIYAVSQAPDVGQWDGLLPPIGINVPD